MSQRIPDWIARVIRMFLIGSVGVFVASYSTTVFNLIKDFASIGPGDNLPQAPDLTFWRNMLFAMAAGGVLSCVSFIVNAVEQKLGRGFLKQPSPPAAKDAQVVADV